MSCESGNRSHQSVIFRDVPFESEIIRRLHSIESVNVYPAADYRQLLFRDAVSNQNLLNLIRNTDNVVEQSGIVFEYGQRVLFNGKIHSARGYQLQFPLKQFCPKPAAYRVPAV